MSTIQTKEVIQNNDVIIEGMKIVYDAVKSTLGPSGSNVIIQNSEFDVPFITNDGVTVAKSIVLEDTKLNVGALLLKESAIRTNEVVGDGTTTSVILTYKLIENTLKALEEKPEAHINLIKYKKYLNELASSVCYYLKSNSKSVDSYKQIKDVATISSNDDKIGTIVADAMEACNRSGSIIIEDSNSMDTYIDKSEGFKWNKGFMSAFMATDDKGIECEMKLPTVMIIDQKLTNIKVFFEKILEPLVKAGINQLIVVCQGADDNFLYALFRNTAAIKVVLIKPDGIGEKKLDFIDDLSVAINAKYIDELVNLNTINDINPYIGSVKLAKINRSSSIFAGFTNNENVVKYANNILESSKFADLDEKKSLALKERAHKLLDQIVSIKVGGRTENEIIEKKYRIEDSINAAVAAVEQGVSKGAGIALASFDIPYADNFNEEEIAKRVLLKTLKEPFSQNLENSGIYSTVEKVLETIEKNYGAESGLNLKEAKFIENCFDEGIIDPTKVLITALNNAVSVAGLILTTKSAIVYIPKEDKE